MKKKPGNFSWSKLPEDAERILGEDFWNDFRQLFPKRWPDIDFFETPDEGIILLDLPGLQSIDSIRMKQSGSNLILSGHIPEFFPKPNMKINTQERFTGPFERVIHIPFSFSEKEVMAKYRNGLLQIKLRKLETEKHIDIHFE